MSPTVLGRIQFCGGKSRSFANPPVGAPMLQVQVYRSPVLTSAAPGITLGLREPEPSRRIPLRIFVGDTHEKRRREVSGKYARNGGLRCRQLTMARVCIYMVSLVWTTTRKERAYACENRVAKPCGGTRYWRLSVTDKGVDRQKTHKRTHQLARFSSYLWRLTVRAESATTAMTGRRRVFSLKLAMVVALGLPSGTTCVRHDKQEV